MLSFLTCRPRAIVNNKGQQTRYRVAALYISCKCYTAIRINGLLPVEFITFW